MFDFHGTCTSHGVTAIVLGGALLVATPLFLSLFALSTPSEILLARLAGGFLLALGATLLGVRDVTDPRLQRRVVLGNGSCDIVLTGVFAASSSWLGTPGWILAALFSVTALSWAVAWPRERGQASVP